MRWCRSKKDALVTPTIDWAAFLRSRSAEEQLASKRALEESRGAPYSDDTEFESDWNALLEFMHEVISWEIKMGRW